MEYCTNDGNYLGFWASSIYVSGKDVFLSDEGPNAVYWKNEISNTLSASAFSKTNSMSGKDVFVVGEVSTGGISVGAVYWKNGIETRLLTKYPYSDSHANTLFISGNDVFCI